MCRSSCRCHPCSAIINAVFIIAIIAASLAASHPLNLSSSGRTFSNSRSLNLGCDLFEETAAAPDLRQGVSRRLLSSPWRKPVAAPADVGGRLQQLPRWEERADAPRPVSEFIENAALVALHVCGNVERFPACPGQSASVHSRLLNQRLLAIAVAQAAGAAVRCAELVARRSFAMFSLMASV